MATQQELQQALVLTALRNQLDSGDFGRDYRNQKRARATAQWKSLGGEAKLNQLLADPQISNYIIQNSQSGGFLSGLASGIGNFASEAGVKEGLMLAGGALGLNALGAFGAPAAGTGAGMTATELAAVDPYLASIGGASGITPAMETAGMLSAAGAPGATAGLSGNLTGAGLGYGDLGSLATGAVPVATSIPGIGNVAQSIGSQAVQQAAEGTIPAGTLPADAASSLIPGVANNTLGSLISGGAALYAGNQGANAAGDALAEQRRQFDISQANMQPWLQAGTKALGAQQDLMGLGAGGPEAQLNSLMTAPGYQFRLKQGQRGLDASSAARGGMGSGKAATGAINWNQDYASNEYNNRLNQLAGVSGTGQTQANNMANLGQQYGSDAGNSILAANNYRQSGILGAGQALSGWLNPQPKQPTLADLLKGGNYAY